MTVTKILLSLLVLWLFVLSLIVLNNDTNSVRRDTLALDAIKSQQEVIKSQDAFMKTQGEAIIMLMNAK